MHFIQKLVLFGSLVLTSESTSLEQRAPNSIEINCNSWSGNLVVDAEQASSYFNNVTGVDLGNASDDFSDIDTTEAAKYFADVPMTWDPASKAPLY